MNPLSFSEIGAAAVYLLKGILYRQQADAWNDVLRYRGRLEEYFSVLGLQLFVDEAEGYAYLRQKEEVEAENIDAAAPEIPKLMSRRPLSYTQTLMLVLLRKRLQDFEMMGNETRLVLSQREIIDMMRIFEQANSKNERKKEDLLVSYIKRLVNYGFLTPIKAEKDRYEVNRIIKAFLPIEELNAILEKLKTYAARR